MVLAHLAANRHHLRHTGQGEQARAHDKVSVLAHRHRADFGGVNGQRQQHDLAHDGTDGPHADVLHALRQLLTRELQAFPHHLTSAVDVGLPVKSDVDKGQANAGDGADALHARNAAHGDFERNSDELLNFLGRHAAGLCLQCDGGFVQIGKDVYRHFDERQRAHQ